MFPSVSQNLSNENTPINNHINESGSNSSEISASSEILNILFTQNSAQSSFKMISPLSKTSKKTNVIIPNLILKPVALKHTSSSSSSLVYSENLPQLTQKRKVNSSSSLEQEKENQSTEMHLCQTLSQNSINTKQNGFRASNVIRSPNLTQKTVVNNSAQHMNLLNHTPNSLEEQFFMELQKSIEFELQQSQSQGEQTSLDFNNFGGMTTLNPQLISNFSSFNLGSLNESVTKIISSEISHDKLSNSFRHIKEKSEKINSNNQRKQRQEQEIGEEIASSPCLTKKFKTESSCTSYQELPPQEESEEYLALNQEQQRKEEKQLKSNSDFSAAAKPTQNSGDDMDIEENIGTDKPTILAEGQIEKKSHVCNCKKTKCLKLYCDCFAAGEFCGAKCNCCECSNTVQNKSARNKIVESLLEKNPFAFNVKDLEPEEVLQLSLKAQKKLASKKGCNCRRSGCQKKYCQCYQDGLQCSEHCKCSGCENCEKPLESGQQAQSQSAQSSPGQSLITTPLITNLKESEQNNFQYFCNFDGQQNGYFMQNNTLKKSPDNQNLQVAASESATKHNSLQNQLYDFNQQQQQLPSSQALLTQLIATVLSSSQSVLNNPLIQLATLQASLQSVMVPQQKQQQLLQPRQELENSFFFENLIFQAIQQGSQQNSTSMQQINPSQTLKKSTSIKRSQ